MSIRQRIILLISLAFVAIAVIGGSSILQSRNNAIAVKAVTEGVVPSALAAGDLVAAIKDVQLTTITMVSATDATAAEQAAAKLKQLETQIAQSVDFQAQAADSDVQKGLVAQTRESLKNYLKSIEETTTFKLAGQKEMAEAVLFANVAEYQAELSGILETLRIEKNRSKDSAIQDLNDKLGQVIKGISLVTLIAFLVLGGMGSLLYIQITRPLKRVHDEIGAIKTNLDLTHRIPVVGNNEIDQVAASINSLMAEFQSVVQGVQTAGSHVSLTSDHILQTVALLLASIERQNEATSSMAASVQEMAVSVSHVSDSSATAQAIAQTSLEKSKDGADAIEKTVANMVAMAEDVKVTSLTMEELGRRSKEIGSIAGTIKEIADQTNLLALNAAIEAARAGEQGRGFAVVADEVRKLAERTAHATTEIDAVIGAIQRETQNAVGDMHQIAGRVITNADEARHAGDFIIQIRDESERVVYASSEIATALKEQATATELIANQIEKIASMSEGNTAATGEAKDVSAEVKRLSSELYLLVARFKVQRDDV